ncbi:hypothetical protein [Trichormus variabilis]|uniref:Uncharacterized protein n=1 Tax=Trichormus variabilis SAG 1403-4b TaxID=447716 RepID=A0A3S1I5P3_ANAVA|nr:hypothetical protein [Trichormus variabilis]MBD2629885.1 hypothetical protein [Trichormus variabilis FACHB-164]RUS92539.1 hypothetical protein DSM107003_50220 [Trichormus variabilis SAG 1403-4b]
MKDSALDSLCWLTAKDKYLIEYLLKQKFWHHQTHFSSYDEEDQLWWYTDICEIGNYKLGLLDDDCEYGEHDEELSGYVIGIIINGVELLTDGTFSWGLRLREVEREVKEYLRAYELESSDHKQLSLC